MVKTLVAAAVVIVAVLLLTPAVILPTIAPDADAPPAVERVLPEAKEYLGNQLDLWLAHVRYAGVETRDQDDLVILQFDLRPFPYIARVGAYLVSRCTPPALLDPNRMGGGRGVTDFTTDPQLLHLRSDAQPSC